MPKLFTYLLFLPLLAGCPPTPKSPKSEFETPQNLTLKVIIKSDKLPCKTLFEKHLAGIRPYLDQTTFAHDFQVRGIDKRVNGHYRFQVEFEEIAKNKMYKTMAFLSRVSRKQETQLDSTLLFTYSPQGALMSHYHVPDTKIILEVAVFNEALTKDLPPKP